MGLGLTLNSYTLTLINGGLTLNSYTITLINGLIFSSEKISNFC